RHRGPDPEEPADRRELDHEVVAQVHAPAAEEALDDGVLHLAGERRVHHREHLATLGEVAVERIDLRCEQVGARARDHHDGRVVGDRRLQREGERLHLVVRLLERALGLREPRAAAAARLLPGWSERKNPTTFTSSLRPRRTCTVCGDRLRRLFSVRSSRALWRADSASTNPITPRTSTIEITALSP